ncbi:uncharacterized protein LOC133188225 [Saccostrea echinata]|uniref:uncharacterized protein LOC133188225 n=1 Tax=Saccostrea echinata TaxID=191078 RepID=UPI002A81ED7D|nr:uncharacterized protein LOC133188225 [Saccostrea echinata]
MCVRRKPMNDSIRNGMTMVKHRIRNVTIMQQFHVLSHDLDSCLHSCHLITCREPTCTTSGYKYDPSAGCFRVVKRIISTADAKQECIRDGGSLLLVNSEEEGDVLTKELQAQNLVGALVQGSRSNAADPWKDDNGNLLPYTGSGIISNNVNANTVMGYVQGNRFVATDPNSDVIGFICETPVTYI